MPSRLAVVFALFAAGLCAQGSGAGKAAPAKSGKPGSKAKAGQQADAAAPKSQKPAKDDPVTAKDPVIVAIDKFAKQKVSTKRADWKTSLPAPPPVEFRPDAEYFWHVETTEGLLVIKLFPDTAPRHSASVLYLARVGFYDGLQFPRIVKGFMAQGGSPLNSTAGNAGYTLDGEFAKPRLHDVPGLLSAANSGAPNTDGSQFFLTFVPTPHLDGKHTVHGQVVDGLPVLAALEACGVERDGDKLPKTPAIVASWVRVATLAKPTQPASTEPQPTPKKSAKAAPAPQ